ncbi:MAG: S-layer homology domain-containing protein [Oscillospiraceae bacterium]|nr:S-layer homology domain-containing protein [Oscillospiraceae bacterium]
MKKKLFALILVLLMVPAVIALGAQPGYAESQMNAHYAVLGGDQSITIRSHVDPGGRGGYSHALYAVELTGKETKAELDAIAVRLLESGTEPLWGGSKHCYHGGAYTVDPEFDLTASDYAPGSYLYVCYAFGCAGGSYNHVLTPYYEQISTMSLRLTKEAQGLDLRYALTDGDGHELVSLTDGEEGEIPMDAGALKLRLMTGVEFATEKVLEVRADFPKNQNIDAFTFDAKTMTLTPELCGTGTVSVIIGNYLNNEVRTESFYLNIPCAPRAEATVLVPSTCTEEGLAEYRCVGHDINCATVYEQEILPPLGHKLFSVSQYIEKPTATLPGIGMGTCRVCGLIGVEEAVPPIFSDVDSDAFYSEPLDYCHAKGWVTGVTENTFAPGNACVRAQVVTFLWRAAGCPKPTIRNNPFVDVKETDFYYSAVLWALENGITTGTDATHFSPKAVCNRAQVVTFLWRAFDQPESSSRSHPFTDVQANSWYEAPILWAVENGITAGLSATTFGPAANCNRAQIVTFLYRAYAE